MVVVHGQAKLLQVVGALRAVGRLVHSLHCGQQQRIRIAMIAMTTSSSISVNARAALEGE